MPSAARPRQSMRLLGRSYMAYVLAPEPPCMEWLAEIDAWLRGSSGFFVHTPVVLDLAGVTLSGHAIGHLVAELKGRGIRVMGIENPGTAELSPDLPPLLRGGRSTGADIPATAAQGRGPSPKDPAALLLETPIRSGQSIIHPDGDVTVLGSVASGAELVAGGSIHVYGTLRGRAMAGSNGSPRARIFCTKMQAELISIDGYYLTADSIDPALNDRCVQARLEGQTIVITPLE